MLENIKSFVGGKKRERAEDPFAALETKRGAMLTKLNAYVSRAAEKFKQGDVADKAKVGAVAGGLVGTALVTGFPGYMVIVLGMTAGAIGKELYDDYVGAMRGRGMEPKPKAELDEQIEAIQGALRQAA